VKSIILGRVALAILFFGLWEALPRLGAVDSELLPPVSEVLATLGHMLQRAPVRADLVVSALEVLASVMISVPAGILLGMGLAESPRLSAIFDPLVFFLFGIPKSIFLPMFILALGIGSGEKIAFGVFSTMLIVMLSAASAVRSVREDHLLVARSYGATRAQIAWRVYLPSMVPVLLEGLRLAVIFAVTAIILAEMYASRAGMGHLIANWGDSFMMKELFAGVLLLAAVAILINESIRWAEQKCSHWRG
jgi:ABC-type nitrate/sulfonate/bicarbonate transport system permease component